ncbi:MAG TPA: hypothetical protein VE135_28525 [Pyrinomonadaceae bacterium]|nr:hypothetical protein [Pyrinomonadaceae bacterium]
MPNSFRAHKFHPSRPSFLLLLLLSVLSTSGCAGLFGTHKRVQVPRLLTPLAEADKNQLFQEVNRLASVKSIHGKVDLTFEDNSFAESGIAEKYKQADGTVTLQRPGEVYLVIQVPFIAKDIAHMTSDGEHFRVAVLQGDEKFRRFVKGTNNAVYDKLDVDGSNSEPAKGDKKRAMTEKLTVSALSNLRPQHLTDALMVRPISASDGLSYSQSEFYQEELDTRPQTKKGTRIIRGYFILEELTLSGGEAKLLRRFWFDRVGGIRLARLQTFDDRGLLITDVSFFDEKPFGEGGARRLPSRIEITRPHDRYKLNVTYQAPESVVLDREYRPEAFVLENKWQLPEVDLDARQKTTNR